MVPGDAHARSAVDPERTSDDAIGERKAPPAEGERGEDLPERGFPGLKVLGREGEGAFGSVYRAFDEKLEREVALKVLRSCPGPDSPARRNFLFEARALARLRHPNVLQIHNVLEEEGRIGLVMEFIEGRDLEELVRRHGPMGAGEAAQVGIHICRALAAVHGAGLLHRDVKASNVLRESGGRIVLADFGLGVFVDEGRRGEIAGSPLFMSPEQAEGRALDARTDLYSAGVLLYFLATGEFPFRGLEVKQLLADKRSGVMVPLTDVRPDLPLRFVEVVHRALRPDPDERYASAGAMEAALLACLEAERPALPGRWAARPGRRWRGWALAAAAVLVAVGALWFIKGRGDGAFVEEAFLIRQSLLGEEERLAENAKVAAGEKLFLQLRTDRPTYVYLINQDNENHLKLLFPSHELDQVNPIAGGLGIKLPGVDRGWPIDDKGQRESFFLVASLASLGELEALGRSGQRTELTPVAFREIVRGVGESVPAGKPLDEKERLSRAVDELERLAKSGSPSKSISVRKFTLLKG
jgi:eukaryotic-like serine/threonine-protein kinase